MVYDNKALALTVQQPFSLLHIVGQVKKCNFVCIDIWFRPIILYSAFGIEVTEIIPSDPGSVVGNMDS